MTDPTGPDRCVRNAPDRPTPTIAELLEFERLHPASTGIKHEAIRQTFALAPAHYYRLLIAAAETEDALRHDAVLTRQILRRMHGRTTRRARLLRRHR